MENNIKNKQNSLKLTTLGFTLIELIAVLVILAILALIVTPLVMNIIRKARIAADMRSIDAYGRSVELAIANYLLDNGDFPASIDDLTIEYSGDEVVCSTTQLNNDSSIYLSNCTVAGRTVDYTYGHDLSPSYEAFNIGDELTYNNVNYYVIENSEIKKSTVTLLKQEPLTVAEINTYGGVGNENNHVNMYVDSDEDYYQRAANLFDSNYDDNSAYGGMVYYSSSTCTQSGDKSGCINNYETSDVKYVVDAWAQEKVNQEDLVIDSSGYSVRLLKYEELFSNFNYEIENEENGKGRPTDQTASFIKTVNGNLYWYWTMSGVSIFDSCSWYVNNSGEMGFNPVSYAYYVGVRPVITIKKSALN